jgi:N-acetylmuramate 1-kinase
MTDRKKQLHHWLSAHLPTYTIIATFGDASFRCYYRVQTPTETFVVMDAPPEHEDCAPFILIAKSFLALGLRVPKIYASDIAHGFLLLSDFGDQLFYKILTEKNVDELYGEAIKDIFKLQQCSSFLGEKIPAFDVPWLQTELNNHVDWFLQQYLSLELNETQKTIIAHCNERLIENALSQPQVCIHRDYHSKNLLWLEGAVGIIDFQDAMIGPITYDLVSLIRDCYVDWPEKKVNQWLVAYHQKMSGVPSKTFQRWFDWMGMQRHLKALFIFARKALRDNDKTYLGYMPRTLHYVVQVSAQYPELHEYHHFLKNTVLPAFGKKQ